MQAFPFVAQQILPELVGLQFYNPACRLACECASPVDRALNCSLNPQYIWPTHTPLNFGISSFVCVNGVEE